MFPLVPILGGLMCVAVMIGMGIDPEQRIALYCGVPFTILCFVIYHMTQKVKKGTGAHRSHSGEQREAIVG